MPEVLQTLFFRTRCRYETGPVGQGPIYLMRPKNCIFTRLQRLLFDLRFSSRRLLTSKTAKDCRCLLQAYQCLKMDSPDRYACCRRTPVSRNTVVHNRHHSDTDRGCYTPEHSRNSIITAPSNLHRRSWRRGRRGENMPSPPKKKNTEQYFSGNYHVTSGHFSEHIYHVKVENFVNFSDKYYKNSGF